MSDDSKYKSDAFEAIHSVVAGMHRAGTVSEEVLQSFDQACLTVADAPNGGVDRVPE